MRDRKKKKRQVFLSLWSVLAWTTLLIKALLAYIVKDKPWAYRECRGHVIRWGQIWEGTVCPTDLICFVLAVVTTMIVQGLGTEAKASPIQPLPRAGPANILPTQAGERRLGNLCQIAGNCLFSYSGVLCPSPTVFAIMPASHVCSHPLGEDHGECIVHHVFFQHCICPSWSRAPWFPGESPRFWSRAWQSEWRRRGLIGAELNLGCEP